MIHFMALRSPRKCNSYKTCLLVYLIQTVQSLTRSSASHRVTTVYQQTNSVAPTFILLLILIIISDSSTPLPINFTRLSCASGKWMDGRMDGTYGSS